MKYVVLIILFFIQNVFAQDTLSSEKIFSNLPVKFEFGGKDQNHRSGKPMSSYFSVDKKNTFMLWGEDNNITIFGIMMQIDGSLSEEQKQLARKIIKNVFDDSLQVGYWFDKSIVDFNGAKAKRVSQVFSKKIVELSYYPNMSIFLNVANEGETLKH